jgi:LysM repeat protein
LERTVNKKEKTSKIARKNLLLTSFIPQLNQQRSSEKVIHDLSLKVHTQKYILKTYSIWKLEIIYPVLVLRTLGFTNPGEDCNESDNISPDVPPGVFGEASNDFKLFHFLDKFQEKSGPSSESSSLIMKVSSILV